MKKYTCSRQKGTKGHCFQAQVFRPDGTSLCAIEPTDDENEASNMAEFICKGLNEKLKDKSVKRILTENQKTYLLNYFFKNEEFAGWKSIATSLLETGECVVAGTKCIWLGGVGNFIKTENADGFYGCLKYSFDLEIFLTSEHFKSITEIYAEQLVEKKKQLDSELVDIYLLK